MIRLCRFRLLFLLICHFRMFRQRFSSCVLRILLLDRYYLSYAYSCAIYSCIVHQCTHARICPSFCQLSLAMCIYHFVLTLLKSYVCHQTTSSYHLNIGAGISPAHKKEDGMKGKCTPL